VATPALSDHQLDQLLALGDKAGAAIMEVYQRDDHGVETKADQSPLTEADLAAHRILIDGLKALTPEWPVLSEESEMPPFAERQRWRRYWLVDPLDGTKEFINRNGEFTVNVALIEAGVPVFGLVQVPPTQTTYYGGRGLGAHKRRGDKLEAIGVRRIGEAPTDSDPLVVVASRRRRGQRIYTPASGPPANGTRPPLRR